LDHPIFKLEKVVQPKTGETLEDFEGPLDLILFLLNKNKIEIQDIPIALILDQYLAYLEQRKQMDLEVASEFVTMAAHLMYIKTRMLLSIEDEEAQSEMDALIQSLAERQRGDAYARIRKLTERMGPMSEFGRSILTRGPEPMKRGKVYEYDQEPGDLVIAMQEVLDRRGQAETPPLRAFDEIVKREPYPVERKAKELVERLKRNGITRFLLLFRGSRSRPAGKRGPLHGNPAVHPARQGQRVCPLRQRGGYRLRLGGNAAPARKRAGTDPRCIAA